MSLSLRFIRNSLSRSGNVRCLPHRDELHTTKSVLAGHSKWANIRHIKAAKDGQRATVFSRLARQLRMAIQEGGSTNPQLNTLLRNVIDDALKKNMPMASIQNTIKRYDATKAHLKKHCLEIKLVNTPIYMVCVLYTDNLAGLRIQMAPIVKKAGGSFVDARHLFDSRGVLQTIALNKREEDVMTDAIECEAEEFEIADETTGSVNFICDPTYLDRISRALVERGYQIEVAEHMFLPKAAVTVSEADLRACDTLRDKLKLLEGVDDIYDNIHHETKNV